MPSTVLKASEFRTVTRAAEPIGFPALAGDRARVLKRSVDLLFGLAGALVALPLTLLIALAILVESGGPVLFSHARVGRGSRRFRLWKFRTMVQNSEEVLAAHLAEDPVSAAEWAATHKLRRDPRVTRVGRFLRRYSLDELPQIWNVLRGDMSVAGPRPIVETEIARYGSAFPLYALARPGLTGLWQVSGRNDTTYKKRVELDAFYVRNWSLSLDLSLILRTVKVVLRGHGAY